MDAAIAEVQDDLTRALENDELTLPTLPEVALKVREVAEDENANINTLAKVIGEDAALSARIIRVCNSPLMRGSQTVDNLGTALSRMGLGYSCNLAMGLAMEQMFLATSDVVDQRMRAIWKHSTEVAAIATVLCKYYTSLPPDQATLAGLTHEIGALPLLTYAEEHESMLEDEAFLDATIAELQPMLGRRILESWDFSTEIACVPEQHLLFDRRSDAVDYVDVVTVANLHSLVGTDHPHTKIEWASVPAFEALGLPTDIEEESEELILECEEAMAAFEA